MNSFEHSAGCQTKIVPLATQFPWAVNLNGVCEHIAQKARYCSDTVQPRHHLQGALYPIFVVWGCQTPSESSESIIKFRFIQVPLKLFGVIRNRWLVPDWICATSEWIPIHVSDWTGVSRQMLPLIFRNPWSVQPPASVKSTELKFGSAMQTLFVSLFHLDLIDSSNECYCKVIQCVVNEKTLNRESDPDTGHSMLLLMM